jgi:hypothetical protein
MGQVFTPLQIIFTEYGEAAAPQKCGGHPLAGDDILAPIDLADAA